MTETRASSRSGIHLFLATRKAKNRQGNQNASSTFPTAHELSPRHHRERQHPLLIAPCYSHLDRDTHRPRPVSSRRACSLLLYTSSSFVAFEHSKGYGGYRLILFAFFSSLLSVTFLSSSLRIPSPPGHFATLSGFESPRPQGSDLPRLPYPLWPTSHGYFAPPPLPSAAQVTAPLSRAFFYRHTRTLRRFHTQRSHRGHTTRLSRSTPPWAHLGTSASRVAPRPKAKGSNRPTSQGESHVPFRRRRDLTTVKYS